MDERWEVVAGEIDCIYWDWGKKGGNNITIDGAGVSVIFCQPFSVCHPFF